MILSSKHLYFVVSKVSCYWFLVDKSDDRLLKHYKCLGMGLGMSIEKISKQGYDVHPIRTSLWWGTREGWDALMMKLLEVRDPSWEAYLYALEKHTSNVCWVWCQLSARSWEYNHIFSSSLFILILRKYTKILTPKLFKKKTMVFTNSSGWLS